MYAIVSKECLTEMYEDLFAEVFGEIANKVNEEFCEIISCRNSELHLDHPRELSNNHETKNCEKKI